MIDECGKALAWASRELDAQTVALESAERTLTKLALILDVKPGDVAGLLERAKSLVAKERRELR